MIALSNGYPTSPTSTKLYNLNVFLDNPHVTRYYYYAYYLPLLIMKFLTSLLAASAALPIFFGSVVSSAETKCADSAWKFRPAQETEANIKAANLARSKFCTTVASY